MPFALQMNVTLPHKAVAYKRAMQGAMPWKLLPGTKKKFNRF